MGYGTYENPYSTLGEAVAAASASETVCMKAGSSSEILTISKPLTLHAIGGTAIIGESQPCTPPPYNPGKWNDGGYIQYNNNCYNFSNDERTDTFAQPGRACGDMYHSLSCDEVHRAALCDGLVPIGSGSDPCPDDKHRVHLVIWPGRDYHWYRQDIPNGMWSHKPGSTPATDRDGSGYYISNPEIADTGYYTAHCGYLCACGDEADIY